MIMTHTGILTLLTAALLAYTAVTAAFTTTTSTSTLVSNNILRSSSTRLYGSWGKRKKEFVEDEFARSDGTRRGFEKYELQERGDFLRRVNSERERFLKKKDEEYLMIAKMAGVSDQTGDGIEPMGEFDAGEFGDDYEDDIDVSVQWEPMDGSDGDEQMGPYASYDPDTSITRLDNDLDVAGRTGQW